MPDTRREGDSRPIHHDERLNLHLTPDGRQPFRFLPKHGQPYCIGEWVSQHVIRWTSLLPIYIAIVTTLTFIIILWR